MELMRSELTGTWRHGDETIVFGDDTLLLGRSRFSCEEDGGRLIILPAEAEIVVPYRIDGDILCLDVDGVVSVWSRVGAA